MKFNYMRVIAVIAAGWLHAVVQAEPITRQVKAEIIAGYDFIVLQQQGDRLSLKYSDPENFRTRADNPALFNFNINTSREEINDCSVRFITWRQQVSETLQEEFNRGGSMDIFFTPGLAGRVWADKSVISGQGDFTAAYASMTADFFGPANGEPLDPAHWAEIMASLSPPERIIKSTSPRDGKPFKGQETYPFAEFFTTIPKGQDPKLLMLPGSWGDARYAIYTLPCSSLISLPPLSSGADSGESSSTGGAQTTGPADPSGSILIWIIAAAALGLLAIGLRTLSLRRPKAPLPHGAKGLPLQRSLGRVQKRPSNLSKRPENGGVIFPGSPLHAANVAAPLSPAGQLTASNLQMLTGPFKVLRPAYHATGRIGYAQEGVPSAQDYSFGTGFLITPDHVMTNRHVHGFYGHYLTSKEDCGGIEFIAEKDKDASDFIPFNGQPPLLIKGLDIAIYTLARSVKNRTPIDRVSIPTQALDGRAIAVIGYPDTHEPDDPEILAAFEEDPVFAVKRISQGRIFRHSTDNENPYGVQAFIDQDEITRFPMQAICHNASTLSGNSGSPILDIETGDLLGVHFAGFKIFNKQEAANLAMAIAQLTEHPSLKSFGGRA